MKPASVICRSGSGSFSVYSGGGTGGGVGGGNVLLAVVVAVIRYGSVLLGSSGQSKNSRCYFKIILLLYGFLSSMDNIKIIELIKIE